MKWRTLTLAERCTLLAARLRIRTKHRTRPRTRSAHGLAVAAGHARAKAERLERNLERVKQWQTGPTNRDS